MKIQTKSITFFDVNDLERITIFIDEEYKNIFISRFFWYGKNGNRNYFTEDDRDYSYAKISIDSMKIIISLYENNKKSISLNNSGIIENNEFFILWEDDIGNFSIGEYDFFLKKYDLYKEEDKALHINFCFNFYHENTFEKIIDYLKDCFLEEK